MTIAGATPTVGAMSLPREPLSIFGTLAMTLIVVVSLVTEPRPGLSGDGLWVALGVAAMLIGIVMSLPRAGIPERRRIAGLVLVAAAACLLIRVQPEGVAFGALYYVVIMSALWLDLIPALALSGTAVAAGAAMVAQEADDPAGAVISIVLSVIPFKSIDEGIAEGNSTAYGLAAAVWTRDVTKALKAARAIRAGTVWVNAYNLFDAALPFGGFKESGFGRELGSAGLEHYTETKTVWVDLS